MLGQRATFLRFSICEMALAHSCGLGRDAALQLFLKLSFGADAGRHCHHRIGERRAALADRFTRSGRDEGKDESAAFYLASYSAVVRFWLCAPLWKSDMSINHRYPARGYFDTVDPPAAEASSWPRPPRLTGQDSGKR